MHITINVPESFEQLSPQTQEDVRHWTEQRLQMELDLARAEKEGRYSPENIKVMRQAIQQTSDSITQGITRKEHFKQFRQAT